jgi:plastocyanin
MALGSLGPAALMAAVSLAQVPGPTPDPAPVVVEITDQGFAPAVLEVGVGATVEWRNGGELDHTVTADDGSFDSAPLAPGGSFSVTFEDAGTFPYRSAMELDEALIGVVEVVEPADPEPPDAPTWRDVRRPPPVEPADGPPRGDPGWHRRPEVSVGLGAQRATPLPATGGGTVTVAQAGATVIVVDSAYQPRQIEVDRGTTVTWDQVGQLPHTVTADDGSFDSGEMGQGDTFTHSFPQPGSFPYYCEFHGAPGGQGMAGVVVVASAGAGPGPGGEGGDGPPEDGAPSGEGGTLAQTGGDARPIAGATVALLATGIACLAADRRRRATAARLERLQPAHLVPDGLRLG